MRDHHVVLVVQTQTSTQTQTKIKINHYWTETTLPNKALPLAVKEFQKLI